jgi:hypothetical protein
MTITLDIRPETQAKFARQAAAQGRGVEAVAAELLDEALHVPPALPVAVEAKNLVELFEPIRGLLTDEEVDTLFRRNPSFARPVDLE